MMSNPEILGWDEANQDAYDDLIVSIEAGLGRLNLLIAVCDDSSFRQQIITKYEKELTPDFLTYQAILAREEPSLKSAINHR